MLNPLFQHLFPAFQMLIFRFKFSPGCAKSSVCAARAHVHVPCLCVHERIRGWGGGGGGGGVECMC